MVCVFPAIVKKPPSVRGVNMQDCERQLCGPSGAGDENKQSDVTPNQSVLSVCASKVEHVIQQKKFSCLVTYLN